MRLEVIEPHLVSSRNKMKPEEIKELREIGYQKIREGKVAVVILAGGQGSILGFDRPKGEYDIKLPSNKTIFQILIERFIKAHLLANNKKSFKPI